MVSEQESPQFLWRDWREDKFPALAPHSKCKLELLRDYLVEYLCIVLANAQGKELQYLTLIDGFAGGGIYVDGSHGSPLVILEAVREAEALINVTREKPVRIVPVCHFVEREANAYDCLYAQLNLAGYGSEIGKTIWLYRASFNDCVPSIVTDITQRHPRGGNRTIFFLDQFGYADIPANVIAYLDRALQGRAEFIVNFSIGWLADFLSEANAANYESTFRKLGIEGHVDVRELLRLRETLGGNWRHPVESMVGRAFHGATGIQFFSPFYIEPYDNHRGYWLLHLAQKQRARAAMTKVHWSKMNRSKHYGPRGYGILSYKPDLDQTQYLEGMRFDAQTRDHCQTLLAQDLGQLIREGFAGGVPFQTLADRTCNETIADSEMLEEALWLLYADNQIEIESITGLEKRARTFRPTDILRPRRQSYLPGLGVAAIAPSRRVSVKTVP